MTDHHARIEPYKKAIIQEAERWLLNEQPIPFFFFFAAGDALPEHLRPYAKRNIAPAGSEDTLIAVDYLIARHGIGDQLNELIDDLRSGPAKRFATIISVLKRKPTLTRLDLPRNAKVDKVVDEQKIEDLSALLDSYLLTANSSGSQRSILKESLRTAIDDFLARLLQRSPSKLEIKIVLDTLKR